MFILKPQTVVEAPDVSVRIESVGGALRVVAGPCSAFGYALNGVVTIAGREIHPGDFFAFAVSTGKQTILYVEGTALLVTHRDYIGHSYMQGVVDLERGHVAYIDDCTDSLLVCPPRLGDPCLNALYFPPQTNQTFHTHPSLRAGMIVSGAGIACFDSPQGVVETDLKVGDVWYLPTGELHRFRTQNRPMVTIAYHPSSVWGPTDEVHPMKSGTIIPDVCISKVLKCGYNSQSAMSEVSGETV